jgi:DNA-binding SARP family transcriptional activator
VDNAQVAAGPRVRARLLGSLEVWVDGRRADEAMGLRAQELFAYLLVFPESEHSRERLMTALWPDKDATRGSANLRRALFLLRRTLGDCAAQVLSVSDAGLRLRAAGVSSDLADLARATVAAEAGDAAAAVLAACLLAERGELLAATNPEWVLLEQEAWHRRVADAGRAVLPAAVSGDAGMTPRDALNLAHALLALEPTDESAHAAAIALRGALGDRAGAASQYRRCREVLDRELGVEPGTGVETALRTAMKAGARAQPAWHVPELPVALAEVPRPAERPARLGAWARLPDRARASVVFALVTLSTLMGGWQAKSYLDTAESTATELVNEHLVATRMERMPVEGADPSAVDAWFRGKVDYPVRSVPGKVEGFQLYGGGLCAVFGQFAATAVYERPDGARASVFTFPLGDLRLPSWRSCRSISSPPWPASSCPPKGMARRTHSLGFGVVAGVRLLGRRLLRRAGGSYARASARVRALSRPTSPASSMAA